MSLALYSTRDVVYVLQEVSWRWIITRIHPWFSVFFRLVLALTMMTVSGLFAVSGLTLIVSLMSIVSAKSHPTLFEFVVFFACFLVIETTTLMISTATATVRHASFMAALLRDLRSAIHAKPLLIHEFPKWDATLGEFVSRQPHQTSEQVEEFIAVESWNRIAGWIVFCGGLTSCVISIILVVKSTNTSDGDASSVISAELFIVSLSSISITLVTLTAFTIVVAALVTRALYVLWQACSWPYKKIRDHEKYRILWFIAYSIFVVLWPIIVGLLALSRFCCIALHKQHCLCCYCISRENLFDYYDKFPRPTWNETTNKRQLRNIPLPRRFFGRNKAIWDHVVESLRGISAYYFICFFAAFAVKVSVGIAPGLVSGLGIVGITGTSIKVWTYIRKLVGLFRWLLIQRRPVKSPVDPGIAMTTVIISTNPLSPANPASPAAPPTIVSSNDKLGRQKDCSCLWGTSLMLLSLTAACAAFIYDGLALIGAFMLMMLILLVLNMFIGIPRAAEYRCEYSFMNIKVTVCLTLDCLYLQQLLSSINCYPRCDFRRVF